MRRRLFWLCLALLTATAADARKVKIELVSTTDVHGAYFTYDFFQHQETKGGLDRVHSFVEQQRKTYGRNLILLENGDLLQGQPTAYYYNYEAVSEPHLASEILNFMRYDAGNFGNHDVETGHPVYDRWVKQCQHPVLGANIIDKKTGQPYATPYIIIEREGVKIAILGMLTPAIPIWLPEVLWSGLDFEDIEESCRKWIPIIKEKERPDLIVGLFHSGQGGARLQQYKENCSDEVARNVDGFDLILYGHDHRRECRQETSPSGKKIWIVNGANSALAVGVADITYDTDKRKASIEARIEKMEKYKPSAEFTARFAPQRAKIEEYVSRKIGTIDRTISCHDAFFGPSDFLALTHQLQLKIAEGAEISIASPLSMHSKIEKGDITVGDMFNLYKYENQLYTMVMKGKELKGLLEYSYAMWTNQMKNVDKVGNLDNVDKLNNLENSIFRYRQNNTSPDARATFQFPNYNFDSAYGINYTVDVTKPANEKVTILSMADGTPFDMEREYRVAVNSYRGNGGGNLLTEGAGIPKSELKSRIVFATDKDLRFYFIRYIEELKDVRIQTPQNWRFVPEDIATPALQRERKRLFPND